MVRIPEEYQEVEYIESSRRSYINTNIIPNDNMRIYLEGITKEEINSGGFFFGSRSGANGTAKNKFWGLTFRNNYDYGFMGDANIKITDAKKNQHFIFDFNFNENHDIKINNIIVTPQTTTENSYTYPIFLFGINSGGSLDSQQQSFIIKKFAIYNNYQDAQPSLYFIPCYRKSDNEIGMYDTVSKTFYTNSGTGTFLKGHNVYYDDINLLEIRRQMIIYKKDYLKNIEWTQNFFLNGQGFTAHSNAHYSDFIKVTPGKTFILKGYEYQNNLYDRVQGYDKEKKFQKMLYRFDWPIGKFSSTIEIPSNCFYIRISTEKSTELHMYDI